MMALSKLACCPKDYGPCLCREWITETRWVKYLSQVCTSPAPYILGLFSAAVSSGICQRTWGRWDANSERRWHLFCLPLISKGSVNFIFSILSEERSHTWRTPTQTTRQWAQERAAAEDQTQRQKHSSSGAALSPFQITHQNHRRDHKIVFENPFKSKAAALFTNPTKQPSPLNLAAVLIWEMLNLWKPLDVGFLNLIHVFPQ